MVFQSIKKIAAVHQINVFFSNFEIDYTKYNDDKSPFCYNQTHHPNYKQFINWITIIPPEWMIDRIRFGVDVNRFIIIITVEGWIRVFTNSIAPIYKKDNLRKERRRAPPPYVFHPIYRWLGDAPLTKGCAWDTRGGYAWVFQNVPERQLTSVEHWISPH